MVSAQAPGLVRFYKQTPSGNWTPIHQDRIEMLAPGGGASEGAPSAVSKPDTLITIDSNIALGVNDILLVTFESDAGITLDASDTIIRLPIATEQGSSALGNAQFQNPALTDQVISANLETVICGHKVTKAFRVSGRTFFDLQDSA